MAYFLLCIFLSSFLLFQIQPMIARTILPWFGGTTAVWSTVMLFFQILLTGGYAYANWMIHPNRRREIVHLVLLGLSVLLVLGLGLAWKSPITPDAAWKPAADTSPIWEIFQLLTVSVGLPYFLLSSNSPLMQAWFARSFPEKTAYRLYALSNLASFLALISYPILIEPLLALPGQGWQWSLAYLVYAGLAAWGAVRSLRAKRPIAEAEESPVVSPLPAAGSVALWIALATAPSILLLATTSRITQEVAVIPFLWVLPLTIYLLTFILAFSGERWYSRQFYLLLLFGATLLYGWLLLAGGGTAIIAAQIGVYSFVLFAVCMVCHGELYRLRPPAGRLTLFYLMVSVGGALGGIFITFVAPFAFKGYWEMPLGIVLCWLLFAVVMIVRPQQVRLRLFFVLNNMLILSSLLLTGMLAYYSIRNSLAGSLYIARNFYGVVRVRAGGEEGLPPDRTILLHGITIHGAQYLDPARRDTPTMYFTETSGVGVALLNYPRTDDGLRVGVLGLGIGTLASYGKPGDTFRFYEINPAVIHLAEGQGGYFSFLEDSPAAIEVVPGDARLSLEAELAAGGSQNYDILILDVFSSDSIPVHLLDVESFELYLQHLQPNGLLALHITNRHLDLVPVAWRLARHFDLGFALIHDRPEAGVAAPSLWVLLGRDPALLASPAIQSRVEPMGGYTTDIRLWTDDYSNLFQILK